MFVAAQAARGGYLLAASLAVGLMVNPTGATAQTGGAWSDVIQLPNNPIAAAVLYNGKVLSWSSNEELTFETDIGSVPSQTYTSLFDPMTGRSVLRLITSTLSDMFCPGIATLPDGRVMVNGGSSSPNANIYDPAFNSWTAVAPMNIPRGYNSSVMLTAGGVLTLGGSWSGAWGQDKTGEVWFPGADGTLLPGIPAAPITGPDPEDAADNVVYRGDNHAWLFTVSGGRVFHAGPSAEMHWITTAGAGTIVSAGPRADDAYSMNGQAVMYGIGLILKAGGAPGYINQYASAKSYVININPAIANPNSPVVVRQVASMAYPREFANGVALPNGQVLIVGGETWGENFGDDYAVLVPELWDPTTETFTQLAPMQTPRTYHSTALLLPDGRVFVGGGGQCGDCGVNHLDAEIFSPPYLFNPDRTPAIRPNINVPVTAAALGSVIPVSSDTANLSFALVRMSATTHDVNTDQRRVPVVATPTSARTYSIQVPSDPGIVPPGYYMLFGINTRETPSVAAIVRLE